MAAIVAQLMRQAKPELDYDWIEEDKQVVKNLFASFAPGCFVRAGDAELRILEGRRHIHPEKQRLNASPDFVNKLASSLSRANLIGLPQDYLQKDPAHCYGWDKLIITECKKLHWDIQTARIGAMIFYHAPELLSELVNNKRVLWINYQAFRFLELLNHSEFCQYYGFKNVKSTFINIPDGKGGWIFEQSMDQVLKKICNVANDLVKEFDIAVVGAGAMANYTCIFIRDVLKKQALDVGAPLSAMRGHASRGTFRTGNSKCLVWKG